MAKRKMSEYKKTANKDDRPQKFIDLVAKDYKPYNAAIEAGYSPKYAKTDSHKLRDKYEKEIEELKLV